ncbi:MAG: carboxypeptidase regulatory-like domain-containing protein [Nitrospirae bacterium]|nr:carboxypeptidase regulatory-like domain-containing protein [Nitrospirota bacterium]
MYGLKKGILSIILIVLFPFIAFAQTESNTVKKITEPGYVTGKMESEDKTLVFGYAGFFSTSGRMPDPTRFWKTPDYIYTLKDSGDFDARVPEGKYYVIAIRKVKKGLGPPETGDHFFYLMDAKGPKAIEIKSGMKLDLGTNRTVPVTFVSEQEGITALKGIITDEKDNPVAGIRVGAYSNFTVLGKPDYIANTSDKDGRYELRLPEGGGYYIVARSRPGGPPVSGDYYGRVGEENKPVVIKTGQIVELNIKVYKLN